MKYIINIINCILLVAIPTVVYLTPIHNNSKIIKHDVEIKQLKSEVITTSNNEEIIENKVEEVEEEIQEEIKEEIKVGIEKATEVTIKQESVVQPTPPIVKEETKPTTTTEEKSEIIEIQVGKMSGYGPNCIGCSGYTASGKYVGDGNVYYNDKTYGQVRIVAGDYKYKFGTIIRINSSKVSTDPIIAIVLDRGGSIGIDKKYMFDLLFTSEEEASKYGVSYNVTFEVLRNGY